MERKMMYYNSGSSLGVIGTYIAHEEGEYTFLATTAKRQWILTADLYDSREEATKGNVARFFD